MAHVEYDFKEFKDFFQRVGEAARGGFREELESFLESIGEQFLQIVQDEIIRREVTDSRLLLNSFSRGKEGNVWTISEGGMVLEVGTNVEYAAYVNNGHWTIDPTKGKHFLLRNGEMARFVPGKWDGERFIYDPDAETGMVLKQQKIKEQPYFDSAFTILEEMFPEMAEQKLEEWLDKYFGGS